LRSWRRTAIEAIRRRAVQFGYCGYVQERDDTATVPTSSVSDSGDFKDNGSSRQISTRTDEVSSSSHTKLVVGETYTRSSPSDTAVCPAQSSTEMVSAADSTSSLVSDIAASSIDDAMPSSGSMSARAWRNNPDADDVKTRGLESVVGSGSAMDCCGEVPERLCGEADTTDRQNGSSSGSKTTSDDEDRPAALFNSEVLCQEHGSAGLQCEPKNRIVVSRKIWNTMKAVFGDEPVCEVPGDTPVCRQCEVDNEGQQGLVDERKTRAQEQRRKLSDLFHYRNRPPLSSESLHVLSRDFLSEWKRFVNDPRKHAELTGIENKQLLCPHGMLDFHLPSTLEEEYGTRWLAV